VWKKIIIHLVIGTTKLILYRKMIYSDLLRFICIRTDILRRKDLVEGGIAGIYV